MGRILLLIATLMLAVGCGEKPIDIWPPEPGPMEIRGIVIETKLDDWPVEGALVTLYDHGVAIADRLTAKDGTFSFTLYGLGEKVEIVLEQGEDRVQVFAADPRIVVLKKGA